MSKKKVVFFDRDGTLIVNQHYLNNPDLIVYLPGVLECLAQLRDAGFTFVMVTNQSGIAKGIVTVENMHEIHRRMYAKFRAHGIDFAATYFSPHASDSNHEMRKPNPGMLLQANLDLGVDFSQSWMVGDNVTDVEAGRRAGCRTILLTHGEPVEASAFCSARLLRRQSFNSLKANHIRLSLRRRLVPGSFSGGDASNAPPPEKEPGTFMLQLSL